MYISFIAKGAFMQLLGILFMTLNKFITKFFQKETLLYVKTNKFDSQSAIVAIMWLICS